MKDEIVEIWTMHTKKGTFDFGYKMGEAPHIMPIQPSWMTKFSKKWDNPSDPIKYEFTLSSEDKIQAAIDFLYNNIVTEG